MEQPFGHFKFSIVRYVPDTLRGEFVNIGIVIADVSGARPPMVRFTPTWDRVKAFDPDADVETLQELEQDLNLLFVEAPDPETVVNSFQESFSNNLELTLLKGRTAASMDSLAEDLMFRFVVPRSSNALYKVRGAG